MKMDSIIIDANGDNPLYADPRDIDSEIVTMFANIKKIITAESITLKTNSRRRESSVFDRGSINRYKKVVILFIGLHHNQELGWHRLNCHAELFVRPRCSDTHDSRNE
jgi:hypothetical protein